MYLFFHLILCVYSTYTYIAPPNVNMEPKIKARFFDGFPVPKGDVQVPFVSFATYTPIKDLVF